MPELWLHDGTAPRKARELYFHDGTAPRKIKQAWYHDGTAIRLVFSGVGVPALSNHTNAPGAVASASFRNDGSLVLGGESATTAEWLTGTPAATATPADCAAYDIRFTYVSGPNTHSGTSNGGGADKSGDAYGVWLNLAVTRQITLTAYAGSVTGYGSGTLVFDVEIRPAGGGANLATCRITLGADV